MVFRIVPPQAVPGEEEMNVEKISAGAAIDALYGISVERRDLVEARASCSS